MGERQQMGVQDALWLEMDVPGNLMVVDSLFWTSTPLDWDRYLELARERLWDRYAVFRSVPVRDGDGAWCWEEQPDADFEARWEHVVLPEPGGDAELQDLVAAQRTVPLDRAEPLWRGMLVDGFHGGSAVLFRGHHAIADGIRMVQLALSIFDPGPDGTGAGPQRAGALGAGLGGGQEPPAPRPSLATRVRTLTGSTASTSLRLARGAVTNPVGAADSAVALTGSLAGAVTARARAVLGGVPGDVDTARKLVLGTRNDTTGWTGRAGEQKAVAWSPPLRLHDVKAVARAHDATVNDLLVTCVAESLRAYVRRHHAVCHSVSWDVPVNLKPFDPTLPLELGNSFALVQLELPTDLDDPVRTLEVVRRRMRRIKRGHEAVVDFGLQAVIARMSSRAYRATIDLLASRAVGVLTNVPGPTRPLYVAGQKVEGMMGWAPTTADQAMSLTIYSYDGKVFVGLAADAGLVPDHVQILEGFADAFRRLAAHAPVGAR